MTNYRAIRVAELIQAEIADLLLRQLKDPRLHMTTISRVEVSPDLRYARVYISHTGNEAEQQAAVKGFLHAHGFIRSQLGKRLKLRYVPQLDFKLDNAIAYGVRISRMLSTLVSSDTSEDLDSSNSHG
jgi:ribosome-binding factor A